MALPRMKEIYTCKDTHQFTHESSVQTQQLQDANSPCTPIYVHGCIFSLRVSPFLALPSSAVQGSCTQAFAALIFLSRRRAACSCVSELSRLWNHYQARASPQTPASPPEPPALPLLTPDLRNSRQQAHFPLHLLAHPTTSQSPPTGKSAPRHT